MVDGHVAGDAVRLAVKGAGPGAAGGVAVAADLDVVAVAAEDVLAGAAAGLAGDRLPVGEEVAVVGAVVVVGGDGEAGEEGAGGRLGGDAGL